jgi:hypothetical protein
VAGVGGAFAGLLGNQLLQQLVLYNLVGQLVGSALQPYFQTVANASWAANPTVPLSPAELSEAVLRQAMGHDAAQAEAAQSGINADRFHVLELLAGNAPAPEELAVALRRKIITQDDYARGIAQGRLRNEWGPVIQKLSVVQPSPQAMLEAELEGQLSHADALARYTQLGGDPDYYQVLFDTEGQAPTPVQALELLNRGIIAQDGTGPSSTSYTQAFLEGPWRNKWLQPFLALREYLPPPRTVVAMLREGSISQAEASTLLAKQGLAANLVKAYVDSASAQKTAGAKQLAQSTITTLYHDRLITRAQGSTYLQDLGYSQTEADYILQVVDAQLAQRFLSAAVGRVHSRYVGFHIDRAVSATALKDLGIDQAGASDLLSMWDIERSTNAPTLTPSQIAKSWHDNIITQDQATARLKTHGYSDADAWLFLSQYQGAAAANRPAGV